MVAGFEIVTPFAVQPVRQARGDLMTDSVFHSGSSTFRPLTWSLSKMVEWVGAKMIGEPKSGALTVTFPNNVSRTIGDPQTGFHARVKFNNFNVLHQTMRRGTLGFAAAYINGDVEVCNLTDLFRFFLQNIEMFDNSNPGIFRRAAKDIAYHVSRANSLAGSRKNIAEHYDLGNDFYSLWLDPSMTYSSAIFARDDMSLEQAQKEKYHRIAAMAGVKPGSRVLEIGCGWGGMAKTLAEDFKAIVHGITLSREQLKFARDCMVKYALDDRVDLEFEDYRDTKGRFDHVCSIEMIEAVGEEHWPHYFKVVHDRLKPGGTATIQAITIDEIHFDAYRSGPDFIQRYIFPGGMLLTKSAMLEQGEKVGLKLEKTQCFANSYAKTLQIWHQRFVDEWPQIRQLGYDESFRRKWEYYMSYCESGFSEGFIDVGIYQYRRPG